MRRQETPPPPQTVDASIPQFWVMAPDDIVLGGRVRTREDAQYAVDFLKLVMGRLPSKPAQRSETPEESDLDESGNGESPGSASD